LNKHYQATNSKQVTAFATTNRGLEQLLVTELETFAAQNIQITNAGVKFTIDLYNLMALNLHSNYSSRILLEVASGSYSDENDIYRLCYDIDWQKYFAVTHTIKVKTSAINCALKSLNFVSLKVKDAICDKFMQQLNVRPNVDKLAPDMRIYAFLSENQATIYLDTSGESLFKRGYRQDKLTAPLKENLACGLLALSNWQRDMPLLDAMCGSGTIIIEALRIALNVAPGLSRNFAFEQIKIFAKQEWQKIRMNALQKIDLMPAKLQLYANDIEQNAITMAQDNLNKFKRNLINLLPHAQKDIEATVNKVYFTQQDILELLPPASGGIMIANLPYGIRLEEQDQLALFYPLLATHLKKCYAGWNTYFLTSDLRLPKLMRLKPSKKTPLFNGALDCRLFEIKMIAGSNRG